MTTATPTSARLRAGRDSSSTRSRARHRGRDGTESAQAGQRRRVSSLPFLALIAGLMGAGLLGLLMINNSLAAGSFTQARYKSDRILLGEQEQALRQEVERLSSPTRVREAARQAGLVPAATTAYFDVATGQILGVPLPADGTIAGAPATTLPPDPAAIDPITGQPLVTEPTPAPVDPEAAAGATPADPEAVAGATPADPDEADGAVVGGEPAGVTAYDRAIVSGGGR